jgi:raffinose/stachyose/melibiose transport system permease protein
MDFGVGQAQAIILFFIVAVVSLLQVYFTRKGGTAENARK